MEVIDTGNSSLNEKSEDQKLKDELLMHELKSRETRNKMFGGIILIGLGIVFLARQMGVSLPHWMFNWPVLLMIIGLFLGVKDSFQKVNWLIVTFIGFMFFLRDIMPEFNLFPYLWPVGLILVGMFIILKPTSLFGNKYSKWKANNYAGDNRYEYDATSDTTTNASISDDYLDTSAVFGSVKRSVISKTFKGGEVNCVFGGGEINLTQADIQGVVRLELNAVFGGMRLIVPSNWEVKSELTAVFGSAEDKRMYNPNRINSTEKLLILEGNAVFGGIEILSFA
nr:hypothetical protein [Bacteroidota bacterium]